MIAAGPTPLHRPGILEDIGNAALMLASPWPDFATGEYITWDAGLVMR